MAGPVKGAQPPGTQRLFVLSSPEELARAAAGRLWGIVRERATLLGRAGSQSATIAVALSGGETPRDFLAALVAEPYRGRFPWERVHFFQVDERWVPPDDPRSNQRMLRELLVGRALVPEGNFHAVDTSLADVSAGARRYEEVLRRSFPDPPGGLPRFDAVLLGLGRDGHTASLFLGSPALEEEKAWVAPADGGSPPVSRVTLTLPVLNAAAQVIFLVSGKEKAETLRDVVLGRNGDRYPASRVSPRRGKVTFLADAPAASRFSPGERAGGREGERPG